MTIRHSAYWLQGVLECATCGRVAARPLARMSPVERKQWQHTQGRSVCRTCSDKAFKGRMSLDQLLERTSSGASIDVCPPPPPPLRPCRALPFVPALMQLLHGKCLAHSWHPNAQNTLHEMPYEVTEADNCFMSSEGMARHGPNESCQSVEHDTLIGCGPNAACRALHSAPAWLECTAAYMQCTCHRPAILLLCRRISMCIALSSNDQPEKPAAQTCCMVLMMCHHTCHTTCISPCAW